MVGYVATGFIFAVLESPKSFTGTRHVRSCLIIILNLAAREHPRAGSKQMATYQAVVAQTQSSSSSSNLYSVTVLFIPGGRIQAAGLFMQGGTFSDVMCGTILAAAYDGRSRG